MVSQVLVVEGNPPEFVLAAKRSAGATPARRLVDAVRGIDPAVRVATANPFFSDHDPDAIDFAATDGMAVTASAFSMAADDPSLELLSGMFARAFDAGVPVIATGAAMLVGACCLGAAIARCPDDPITGIARAIRPAGHPMTKGRYEAFDALTLSRNIIADLPDGSAPTASSDGCSVAALACARDGVEFWGMSYQPEATLADLAFWLGPQHPVWPGQSTALARDLRLIGDDPAAYARLSAKHRIGLDLLDRRYRVTELTNWLSGPVRRHSRSS
ncbi:MAG: hypothetical protein AAF367_12920 [Pseudomonadota bacterium]